MQSKKRLPRILQPLTEDYVFNDYTCEDKLQVRK